MCDKSKLDQLAQARDKWEETTLHQTLTRVTSDIWRVPDTVPVETVAELRAWAVAEYSDLAAPLPVEWHFVFDVIRL